MGAAVDNVGAGVAGCPQVWVVGVVRWRWLDSVRGMNPFDAYIEALAATSVETLRHFDLDVALAAGMAPDRARAWAGLQ